MLHFPSVSIWISKMLSVLLHSFFFSSCLSHDFITVSHIPAILNKTFFFCWLLSPAPSNMGIIPPNWVGKQLCLDASSILCKIDLKNIPLSGKKIQYSRKLILSCWHYLCNDSSSSEYICLTGLLKHLKLDSVQSMFKIWVKLDWTKHDLDRNLFNITQNTGVGQQNYVFITVPMITPTDMMLYLMASANLSCIKGLWRETAMLFLFLTNSNLQKVKVGLGLHIIKVWTNFILDELSPSRLY